MDHKLHEHFCTKLGLDPHAHGLQTTKNGKFSVEFVECLAGCGMAPVMMCNEDFHEGVTNAKADEIVNIFSQATPIEKTTVINLVSKMDAANSSKYQKIMKQ